MIEPDVPQDWERFPRALSKLPPNAPLQAEIAWVTANRLVVRSGKGVDLARALSPQPELSGVAILAGNVDSVPIQVRRHFREGYSRPGHGKGVRPPRKDGDRGDPFASG